MCRDPRAGGHERAGVSQPVPAAWAARGHAAPAHTGSMRPPPSGEARRCTPHPWPGPCLAQVSPSPGVTQPRCHRQRAAVPVPSLQHLLPSPPKLRNIGRAPNLNVLLCKPLWLWAYMARITWGELFAHVMYRSVPFFFLLI